MEHSNVRTILTKPRMILEFSVAMSNRSADDVDDDERSVEEEEDPADQMLKRGAFLRQLREMERQDELERSAETTAAVRDSVDSSVKETVQLSGGEVVLRYEAFLEHQRYYDDLKHVDVKFIDYGSFGTSNPLVIEQDKSLGKGGLCWDAAFILGEHMIHTLREASPPPSTTNVLELGCGTGLCGLIIAKALPVYVVVTDLPEQMPLLERNVARNFLLERKVSGRDLDYWEDTPREARGSASAAVLAWGDKEEEAKHSQYYDYIIGADVVATLYDPVALADTIYNVSKKSTKVFISFKERLSSIHRQFETAMHDRFQSVQIIPPLGTRNLNPAVQILVAEKKKKR